MFQGVGREPGIHCPGQSYPGKAGKLKPSQRNERMIEDYYTTKGRVSIRITRNN
jgi:hypothetical protein